MPFLVHRFPATTGIRSARRIQNHLHAIAICERRRAIGAGFGMRALFGSNVDRVLRQAPCPDWLRARSSMPKRSQSS